MYHAPIDFEEIAKSLQQTIPEGEVIDYVFFAAYKQEESEQGNWDTNGRMLESFLKALEISGIEKRGLKRVLLIMGAKYYGVHLGPVKNPCEESDPRVEGEGWPSNLYYNQEDILKEKAKGKSWDGVIFMPNDIGVVSTRTSLSSQLTVW